MRQGGGGTSRTRAPRPLPSDCVVQAETASWRLHVSQDHGCLVVEPLDYHAGPLYLDVEDLERALAALKKAKPHG